MKGDLRDRPVSSITLLVPTRNEADNLGEFVDRTRAAMHHCPVDWELLFADDSDDGTPQLIEELAGRGLPIRLRHREPSDRHDSITGALCAALPDATGDVIVVIDADLQHPPEILPHLLTPVVSGAADFAIGSRYGEGGSAEGLSGAGRRLASRGSSLFTRTLFPSLWRCSDLASGLFAFRRDLLEGVTLRPRGLKMLPEIVVRGAPDTIVDVPYVFAIRSGGQSKATVRDGLTLLRHLLTLRLSTCRLRRAAVRVADPGPLEQAAADAPTGAWPTGR